MEELEFIPKMQMDKKHKDMTITLWAAFKRSFPGIIELYAKKDISRLRLGGEYKITWCCAWNHKYTLGHKCVVLATAPGFAIVSVLPHYEGGVYRNEDLEPIK